MTSAPRLVLPFALLVLASASIAIGASTGDPALNSDPRFAVVPAQPGSGNGSETGTYLPPLAGASGEITGTVLADSGAGPTDFYVGAVGDDGTRQYWKGTTDAQGHFHLRVPQIAAGVATLLLFKHFDAQGKPDEGATSRIAGSDAHLENSVPITNAPNGGPAIVEARTSYELGGQGRGIIPLRVRDIDPRSARVLVDGSERGVDTVATSDLSVVGKLRDDTALGRHAIAVRSTTGTTNAQAVDVVRLRFDPIGELHTGQVATVRLHVDGVGNDPAQVTFSVGGSASIADGSTTATVPVTGGVATTEIRGRQPGELVLRTLLDVAVPAQLAETTPTPMPTQTPSLKPKATPKPKVTKTPKPTPTPTPTAQPPLPPPPPPLPSNPAYPETPEPEIPIAYATPTPVVEVPPCILRLVDGSFEPTQGVWQDDPSFVDLPGKQLTRVDPNVPKYFAEIPMVVARDSIIAGVDHYRLGPPYSATGPIVPVGRHADGVKMIVETNCTTEIKGVHFHYLMTDNGNVSNFLPDSIQIQAIPTRGPPGTLLRRFTVSQDFADDTPFRFAKSGPYSLYATLEGPDNAPLFNGAQIQVDGNAITTVAPVIALLPARLAPEKTAQLASLDRAGGTNAANTLKAALVARTSDYFPIPTGPIPVQARSYRDLSGVQVPAFIGTTTLNLITGNYAVDLQSLLAALAQTVGTTSLLQGATRTVILLDGDEFRAIVNEAIPNGNALAFTTSPQAATALSPLGKVIIAPRTVTPLETLHEVVHTLPPVWAETGMIAECKKNYHNINDTLANGFQVTLEGKFAVRDRDSSTPIMGPSLNDPQLELVLKWIAQCTYRHLADLLQQAPDPPGWIVRGYIYSNEGKSAGRLLPAVPFEGAIDPHAATASTPWQIVVRNASGAALARYDIAPQFVDADIKLQYRYLPVLLPIPRTPSAARIELYGPGGKYDSVTVPQ